MKSKYGIAVSTLLLGATLSAGNPTRAIPHVFLGDWGTSLAACGTQADDTALHIGERHVSYRERSGPLLAVVVRGAQEVALIAELTSDGEGRFFASTFALSPDGNQLTQSYGVDGETIVRVRCDSMLGSRSSIPSSRIRFSARLDSGFASHHHRSLQGTFASWRADPAVPSAVSPFVRAGASRYGLIQG